MSISKQVEQLEMDRDILWDVATNMLATIRVNRSRGLLTSADEEHFSKIIDAWHSQLMKVQRKGSK